jgi:hypothetical protein
MDILASNELPNDSDLPIVRHLLSDALHQLNTIDETISLIRTIRELLLLQTLSAHDIPHLPHPPFNGVGISSSWNPGPLGGSPSSLGRATVDSINAIRDTLIPPLAFIPPPRSK